MIDVVQLCAACGHPDFVHTRAAGKQGDCLQWSDGRLDCACEEFVPEEEDE